MKEIHIKYARFEHKDHRYCIEVKETLESFEAWIARNGSGVSMCMFSLSKKSDYYIQYNGTFETFCYLVEGELDRLIEEYDEHLCNYFNN